MCETTVYLERDGQLEKLMDDVSRMVVTADGLELTRLPQTVRAELRVLCLLPIGHPAEQKPQRTRFEASKVHGETW